MLRTFNCGIRMVLCVDEKNTATVLDALAKQGETAFVIGAIHAEPNEAPYVKYQQLDKLMPGFVNV